MIGCGLRRAEVLRLEVDQIQQREGRWVIPDMLGKGKRLRTVPVPAAVKVRVEEWIVAADLYRGRIFRPVNKADHVVGTSIADEKAIWQVVLKYAKATSLGKLSRTTCAAPAPSFAVKRVAISNKFNCSSGTPRFRLPSGTWGRNRTSLRQ